MADFNISEDMIIDTIASTLEDIGAQVSEETFMKIADRIDESFPGIIALLAQGVEENWKAEAMGVSTGWGSKYAQAIKSKVSGDEATVYIDESMKDPSSGKDSSLFVSMVENGMRSFSIKEALLKSEKARLSSDGVKYIVVPFPVAIPRRKNQGTQASKFGGREMSEEAYRIVKNGGKFSGKLKSGQEVSGLSKYVSRQHHSQYATFICVSEKSKGWKHPGVPAEPVFRKVLAEINKQIESVLTSFCQAIVSEYL